MLTLLCQIQIFCCFQSFRKTEISHCFIQLRKINGHIQSLVLILCGYATAHTLGYLLSDVYTKDHSSLMADKMLVFFNSDFAYTVKIKYIIAKTTTNASRNSHGNTNVMQWFTASNRLQTITLKMLPNTRAITNEPPR